MATSVENQKRALRAELRERRQLLSSAQLEAAGAGVTAQLDALLESTGARSISCFLSTQTEPGTRGFIKRAVRRDIRVLLPITRADGLLDWAVSDDTDNEARGLTGFPEPTGKVLGPIAVNDVDLMLIPAAAVDRTGMRMGWGLGCYDKTLGSMENAPPSFAVVYDLEVLDEVPSDLHDQPVSGVVTPTRTFTFPR